MDLNIASPRTPPRSLLDVWMRRGVARERGRSQTQTPSGNWVKRDATTGRFMDVKSDGTPFKGVRKEK